MAHHSPAAAVSSVVNFTAMTVGFLEAYRLMPLSIRSTESKYMKKEFILVILLEVLNFMYRQPTSRQQSARLSPFDARPLKCDPTFLALFSKVTPSGNALRTVLLLDSVNLPVAA